MPRSSSQSPPTYRRHKSAAADRAYTTIRGQRIYLGPYGSQENHERYQQILAEWKVLRGVVDRGQQESRTINEVLRLFRDHAEKFYRRPDGTPTSEVDNLKQAARYLRELYGNTPAAEFGPLMLKAVREKMIERGWCRTNINKQVNRIRLIFKWAGENALIPARVHSALSLVAGLRRGRSEAKESEPVKPVPMAHRCDRTARLKADLGAGPAPAPHRCPRRRAADYAAHRS